MAGGFALTYDLRHRQHGRTEIVVGRGRRPAEYGFFSDVGANKPHSAPAYELKQQTRRGKNNASSYMIEFTP